MNTDLLILVAIVGLGTWAMRALPLRLPFFSGRPGGAMSRFLAATGPAALAALTAASFLPLATPDVAVLGPTLVGSAAVVGGHFATRDMAAAALVGAVAYGITVWLIGV
ncbi:AzlD domain-containing protein [Pelagibacterium montanilacus]|uniref:AzlD domain-containing protein n=1 Tax=Pelagibacterium montanilacus TaxID=2185280 RepID=UPI000F8CBE51|nr:AzlD domain-containing protein [Pelagibacterium montanilacus]